MRKINITIVGLLCCLSMMAQTISVSSFILLDTDLTANTAGTMEIDQNGETAALIKVVTTQTGFTFDGGALGIVKTVQKPSEVWVYVPRGLKRISISHPQLGLLRDYYFNIPIEAARTYEMVLVSGKVQTIVKPSRNSQYIVFQLTPSNAVVELDGELLETINGVASKIKNVGTYNYRVQAPNYFLEAGSVTIDDPTNKKIVNITLKPNFAHVTVDVDNNAEIWINGEKKGVGSWIGDIGAGIIEFEARKEGHQKTSLTQEIIASSEIHRIHLQSPIPIYGELNISSNPPMSDVIIDGQSYGQTPLIIPELLIGNHELVVRHQGFGDFRSYFVIEENKVFEIEAVLKNHISINIRCNQPYADFYIDGKPEGKASGTKQLEVGVHRIEVKPRPNDHLLSYDRYIEFNGSNDIFEIILEPEYVDVSFTSDKPGSYVVIDEQVAVRNLSMTPKRSQFKTGTHDLRFSINGKKNIKKRVEFNSSQNSFHVSFKKHEVYLRKKEGD